VASSNGNQRTPFEAIPESGRKDTIMDVKAWMTKDPVTAAPGMSIKAAWRLLQERRIRHLPVVDAGKLVGIVTDRDLRRVLPSPATSLEVHELNYLLDKMTLGEVMTKDIITTTPFSRIPDAARTMLRNRIGALPVVEGGKLVGILSQTDVLEALTSAAEAQAVERVA
jgi:acetoin utilization protein AcuB